MDIILLLISFLPMAVCLGWFVAFVIRYSHNDSAKKILTWFLATCVVLYSCHAIYFNFYPKGLPPVLEALWALCSLSVYPLYFIYISQLTNTPQNARNILIFLLPGMLVAGAIYLYPGETSDNARKLLNLVQVMSVCYFGYRKLQTFDKQIANVYADTEGKDLNSLKILLVAFVITSLLSAIANFVGKQYFVHNGNTLVPILVPFAIMLYALSYIGYTRSFSVKQFIDDITEPSSILFVSNQSERNTLEQKIERLMKTEKIYLRKGLTIKHLAYEVGSCRTYVSNTINQMTGKSFSDYVNKMRIEHAKELLLQDTNKKMSQIAEASGFTNQQSFYRNFRKFAGMKPTEWINHRKQ